MNRNVESHFSELPKIEISRSTFDRSSSHKTSFNTGELIPFFIDEILPGDSFKVTTSVVARLQTLLTPIMDNVYMDTYYFFVPCRILWTHWKEFMGEATANAWMPQTEYSVPRMVPPDAGWNVGTIADYFGIPVGVGKPTAPDTIIAPISLPFRAYALICNEWFRDQNLTDPINITYGDTNQQGVNTGNYITDIEKGGLPFKVSKFHDYFTATLPSPQRGPNVGLVNSYKNDTPVNFEYKGPAWAPVYARDAIVNFDTLHPQYPEKMRSKAGDTDYWLQIDGSGSPYNVQFALTNPNNLGILPSNLWADISQSNITINDLRMAFQLQKYFEKNARAGVRYREIIREHFGVVSSDARMQIPEYLGGHRFPLSIHQVTNQSQGDSDFLGDLGAMSNTSDVHEDFVKSFEEHGYVIGVCCVRYDHSYPQGMERMWMRNRKLDYYFPVFANLGEQGVKKEEIYWTKKSDYQGADIFGYQEAWAEYRYKPSRVSGEMRPGVTNSLATWHLADYYQNIPSLSDSWIREDKSNVDRVLAVTSAVANQVFADFYIKCIATRPMPMYSIPGLIDHH